MRRRLSTSAVALALATALLPALGCGGEEAADERGAAPRAGEDDETVVELHFPATDGRLRIEERELPRRKDPPRREDRPRQETASRLAELAREVLRGPVEPGLLPPFPDEVEIADVYLTGDAVAWVDLVTPEPQPPPSGGSLEEMLSVYSLVNSLLVNEPEVRAVALLWNGRQRESFSGHLDTSQPLVANLGLVAPADAPPLEGVAGSEAGAEGEAGEEGELVVEDLEAE